MQKESKIRDPLIIGNKTYHDITRDIARPVEGKANKYWWILFSLSAISKKAFFDSMTLLKDHIHIVLDINIT